LKLGRDIAPSAAVETLKAHAGRISPGGAEEIIAVWVGGLYALSGYSKCETEYASDDALLRKIVADRLLPNATFQDCRSR
jgi:hypothetical protein